MVAFLKDNKPHVDLGISYALSRSVFSCPSTKFGVRIPLWAHAQSAKGNNWLYLQVENFVQTTSITFNLYILFRQPAITSSSELQSDICLYTLIGLLLDSVSYVSA
jgi:hypothetical protein